ncbi:MAG: Cof-type HAD-IIB family hydrolase [Hydrococcus sp. C42_A2020_068]|nr:HAD-superfamily hydrolase, subfamily IIB [Pleurocapsa sp. PCC 7327]MBF2020388.1 Cof-type HAD-IIB family hydrolase [Hydrococcus sp. C42_A2020_068]
MDIRLLVLDIDGTISGRSNEISQPVKQAIQAVQTQGIQVALATGRMFRSAMRFHSCIGSQLPLLAYNGAWIQDPFTGEMHQHLPVAPVLARQLLDELEQPELIDRLGIHFYIGDCLYVRQITAITENYAQRSGIEPIAVGDLRSIVDKHPTKVLALSREVSLIEKLLSHLQQRYAASELYLTQSTINFLEATHPHANKGSAVRYLSEQILGLEAKNVMAVGDNFNDAQMLQYAGTSIAMGNAPTALQELADWVAPSVEEDGVAVAIEKFLL